jgi:hypothetical protein
MVKRFHGLNVGTYKRLDEEVEYAVAEVREEEEELLQLESQEAKLQDFEGDIS